MEMTNQVQDDVAVLTISGKIIGDQDSAAFHKEVDTHLEAGVRKMILELSQVQWMNSSGLGLLLGASNAVKEAGGSLVLAAPDERVRELLTITRLTDVFTITTSLEEAFQKL